MNNLSFISFNTIKYQKPNLKSSELAATTRNKLIIFSSLTLPILRNISIKHEIRTTLYLQCVIVTIFKLYFYIYVLIFNKKNLRKINNTKIFTLYRLNLIYIKLLNIHSSLQIKYTADIYHFTKISPGNITFLKHIH